LVWLWMDRKMNYGPIIVNFVKSPVPKTGIGRLTSSLGGYTGIL